MPQSPGSVANLIDAMSGKPILGKIGPSAHNRQNGFGNE